MKPGDNWYKMTQSYENSMVGDNRNLVGESTVVPSGRGHSGKPTTANSAHSGQRRNLKSMPRQSTSPQRLNGQKAPQHTLEIISDADKANGLLTSRSHAKSGGGNKIRLSSEGAGNHRTTELPMLHKKSTASASRAGGQQKGYIIGDAWPNSDQDLR